MKKILIINANYYNNITNKLVLSSFQILRKEKIITYMIKVPGVFEIPIATQTLREKTLVDPILNSGDGASQVQIVTDNITAQRTIRFPDADATLLSTNNVTLDDVNFGAGIGANNLTGQTRLQQFFYAGF